MAAAAAAAAPHANPQQRVMRLSNTEWFMILLMLVVVHKYSNVVRVGAVSAL